MRDHELPAQILSDVLQGIPLLHNLFFLRVALAIVPKTAGSLSKATLQIHEAGEPPSWAYA